MIFFTLVVDRLKRKSGFSLQCKCKRIISQTEEQKWPNESERLQKQQQLLFEEGKSQKDGKIVPLEHFNLLYKRFKSIFCTSSASF